MNALRQQPKEEDKRAVALRKTVESMSGAERVSRRFSAGRPMNQLVTPQQAIWMARALKQQLGAALQEDGLDPNDCNVHIACLTPDLSMLLTYRLLDDPQKVQEGMTSVFSIPVGLIFGVRETDRKKIAEFGGPHSVLGAKPFLDVKLVSDALRQRMAESKDGEIV